MILAKMGERTYEFNNILDLADAREIYVQHMGDQNSLETEFEDAGIEFLIDPNNNYKG